MMTFPTVVSIWKSDFRLFFSTKCPKVDGSDEELSSIFEIEFLATQSNSESGEDVSQIRVWVVEKPAVKTDI